MESLKEAVLGKSQKASSEAREKALAEMAAKQVKKLFVFLPPSFFFPPSSFLFFITRLNLIKREKNLSEKRQHIN